MRIIVVILIVIALTFIAILAFYGEVIFNIEQNKLVFYELGLFGSILGGVFTLGGVLLSNLYYEREHKRREEFERQPYIIVKNVATFYQRVLHEEGERFPWGGDPPLGNCYPIFLEDDEENRGEPCEVAYIKIVLENLGIGIAQNVRFIYKTIHNTEFVNISVLGVNGTADKEIYLQVIYRDEPLIYSFCIEYENYMGVLYRQSAKCQIDVYDKDINGIYWSFTSPEKIKKRSN
jgi:hypothetical protein